MCCYLHSKMISTLWLEAWLWSLGRRPSEVTERPSWKRLWLFGGQSGELPPGGGSEGCLFTAGTFCWNGAQVPPSFLTTRGSGHSGPRPPRRGPHFTKYEQKRLSRLRSVVRPDGREVDASTEGNTETNVGEGRGGWDTRGRAPAWRHGDSTRGKVVRSVQWGGLRHSPEDMNPHWANKARRLMCPLSSGVHSGREESEKRVPFSQDSSSRV